MIYTLKASCTVPFDLDYNYCRLYCPHGVKGKEEPEVFLNMISHGSFNLHVPGKAIMFIFKTFVLQSIVLRFLFVFLPAVFLPEKKLLTIKFLLVIAWSII